jgi:hypothetical protein
LALREYERAPELVLAFPRSGQTWRLRLTPALRRWLATELPASCVRRRRPAPSRRPGPEARRLARLAQRLSVRR